MKRILVFIGLKIVEIAGIIFAPYFIGLGIFQHACSCVNKFTCWSYGLFMCILIALLIVLFGFLIKMNWEWA